VLLLYKKLIDLPLKTKLKEKHFCV